MQISDTHLGFNQAANPNPAATLGEAIAKINALPTPPAFLVHTGDISHLSKEAEWDAADQMIKGANKEVFYIPGEHDVADVDNGKAYLARYGKKTQGRGWYSFDTAGVHFIALVNVFDFKPGFKSAGLAQLGDEQLEWMEKRRRAAVRQHAGRRAGASAAMDGVRAMGLGHRRFGPRARLSETVRLGHRAQRPHPPDHAEGRGQYDLPHRDEHGLSATRPRHRARPRSDAGAAGTAPQATRAARRRLRARQGRSRP